MTKAEILQRVQAGLVLAQTLGDTQSFAWRRHIAPALKELESEGRIKRLKVGEWIGYALPDWQMPADEQLAYILGKCRIDRETGCQLWAGATNGRQGPLTYVPGGKPKTSVRRLVWELTTGKQLTRMDVLLPRCGDPACVAFACIKKAKRGQSQKGRKLSLLTRMRQAIGRKQRSHISDDVVKQLRAFEGTNKQAAERFGLTKSAVQGIRSGRNRREYAANGIFTQLIERKAA